MGGRHDKPAARVVRDDATARADGPIGSGKSSLIEYVTSTGAEVFAPIWISVGHESDEMLRDPPEFARHLIREVVRWARDSQAMADEQRRTLLAETTPTLPTVTHAQRQDFSLKLALGWLNPGFSHEVEETVADPAVERNRGEFVASLDRLVELIRDDLDRVPIVIIDDSDRWLRLDGSLRDSLLDGFFIDTCRMLAERNWAVAMAILHIPITAPPAVTAKGQATATSPCSTACRNSNRPVPCSSSSWSQSRRSRRQRTSTALSRKESTRSH